jgi:hypothetical protein
MCAVVGKLSVMVWEDPHGMTLGVAHPRGMQGHSIRVSTRREHARRPNEASLSPPSPSKNMTPAATRAATSTVGSAPVRGHFFLEKGVLPDERN